MTFRLFQHSPWQKLGLTTRVMLVTGTALLLTGVAYFNVSLRNEVEARRTDLQQILLNELEFLTPAIAEPAVTGDYAQIQRLLSVRAQQPVVDRIVWADRGNHRLQSTSVDDTLTAPAWFVRWLALPEFTQSRDITVGGESYGKVQVWLSTTPTVNRIWQVMRRQTIILVGGIGMLFLLLTLIVANGLRPLRTLKLAAGQFGQGNHTLRIAPSGPPEMQACIQAFNNMAGNIEQLFGSLRANDARNRLLAIIVEQSNVPIITKDLNGMVTSWNSAAEVLYGYSATEMLGNSTAKLHPQDGHEHDDILQRIRSAGSQTFESQRVARNGVILDVSLSVSPLYDEHNRHIGEIAVTRDITRQKRAEEALSQEQERAQVTLASIADAVVTTDIAGNIDYLNPVAEKLLGWSSAEAWNHSLASIFHGIDETSGEAIVNPIEQVLGSCQGDVRGNAVLVSRHGVRFPIEHSAAPIASREGEIIGAVLVFRDVSASHNMARQLSWQASHDALTALVNRREFERRLNELIENAHNSERHHALLYMDLDQFKIVNDTCGHVAGDELLRQLSAMLNQRIRGSDTIARLGGDEFGVLLTDCPPEKAMEVAENLRTTVEEFRFTWQNKHFAVAVSIGVVPIVGTREDNADIMGVADAACYAAKDRGRNQVQASPNARELSQRRGEMLWVTRINSAIEENRLRLYCQPITPIQQNEAEVHYEVLLRMLDQDGNIIPPMSFIPAAERYNLMRTLDRKVIAMTFAEYGRRIAHGSHSKPVTLSLNLSGDTLGDPLFLEFLKKQFALWPVDPRAICFEVTETAAIANLNHAITLIRALKEMGCRFSLDDFGSGLSSFGYLKNLPVDYLKIDGSFVRDMAQDPIDAAMVNAIHNIGHVMGIKTIAEWVEDDKTLALLKQIGINYAQGYYFDRPRPIEDIFPEEQAILAGF